MTRNDAIDRVFRATQDARNVNIGWLIDALDALGVLRFDPEIEREGRREEKLDPIEPSCPVMTCGLSKSVWNICRKPGCPHKPSAVVEPARVANGKYCSKCNRLWGASEIVFCWDVACPYRLPGT